MLCQSDLIYIGLVLQGNISFFRGCRGNTAWILHYRRHFRVQNLIHFSFNEITSFALNRTRIVPLVFKPNLQIVILNLQNTVSEHQSHTPSREERHFLYFNHLSKEFLEQMIPHLKALIQGIQNLQKNWPWHHFEAGYAPLTEKALLLLELVWSLS